MITKSITTVMMIITTQSPLSLHIWTRLLEVDVVQEGLSQALRHRGLVMRRHAIEVCLDARGVEGAEEGVEPQGTQQRRQLLARLRRARAACSKGVGRSGGDDDNDEDDVDEDGYGGLKRGL
jgi:hypothetical protein